MLNIVIVANGQIDHPMLAREYLSNADLTIAANGGTHHCLGLDHQPDLIIGDLDSLDESLLEDMRSKGVDIRQHPRDKDATDLELALKEALDRQADEIVILGAVGGRWDQSLANLHLVASPRWYQQRIEIIDGPQRVFPIHPRKPFSLDGERGDLVSLIPIGGDAHGVEIEGFKYPLKNETLNYDNSRGTSNELINPPGRISLRQGRLLCLVVRGGEAELLKSGGT